MLNQPKGSASTSPFEHLGLARDREPQRTGANIPSGLTVVSADSHFPLTDDPFEERFPEHLRHKAPHVRWIPEEKMYQMIIDGRMLVPNIALEAVKSFEDRPGCQNVSARMKEMLAEGVEKEIVFPQILPLFTSWPDFEVREHIFLAYNDYMTEQHELQPDRFFPVATPNFWDPIEAPKSIWKIAEQGFKTFLLPMMPGKMKDGTVICYQNSEYDAMWAAIQETGMPACFHIGERLEAPGRNGYSAMVLAVLGPTNFRHILGQLIFGGVLDRFPDLKIVFAEAGINWVAGALQDAEMIYDTHSKVDEFIPKHRPRHYWHKNCYASFMWDPCGLALIDEIGADRVMWSSDYPHNESTFGFSQTAMQGVIDAVNEADARLILGDTATKVFRL